MKNYIIGIALSLFSSVLIAQTSKVKVIHSEAGMHLMVDGERLFINGMNWDYIPIGNNYNYSLWKQSDDVIKAALDSEMSLLKNMGVNVIRQYTGVQPKWITYIYENYGIYTMLNHSFGRYGLTINGAWTPVTDYRDEETKNLLMNEVTDLAEQYKNTTGLLLFLLGNENNYGLFWAGAETEDFPDEEEKKQQVGELRGRPMYRLMNDAAIRMKAIDSNHPIAICNGDLLFVDIIAEECKDVDIYGTNMYRGKSFGDAFERVKKELKKPILITEFGSDAFNAKTMKEDQKMQAFFMVENWEEIYKNAAGLGLAENSLGGFTFQFSDGWWKYGQTKNLDVHDSNASWSNGGYYLDLDPGENNMNEEWFGICAKGPTNVRGLYDLYPRAAYYALKEAHHLNPYAKDITVDFIDNYFNNINLQAAVLKSRGDQAALKNTKSDKLSVSKLRAEFSTFNTGGTLLTTPESAAPNNDNYPNQLGFDHMQSYFVGVEGNPTSNMRAEVVTNIVGNVAENPIDQIFYETRGRSVMVNTDEGSVEVNSERLDIYQASYEWNAKDFDLRGFYRTGHYHWGYEGDFFGLYPEANYGPNLDIYNGIVSGFELDGKRQLKGFKAAFGPQLWWGANPAFLLKYSTKLGKYGVTAVFHEDIDEIGDVVTSNAIPMPKTRRFGVHIERDFGNLDVEIGGLWAGQPLNGRKFQFTQGGPGNYVVYTDEVNWKDNWGAKAKFKYSKGRFNWYGQGAAMGLVANGGADNTKTFTGWKLKDSGSGNQTNFLTGLTYTLGDVQLAPNFLWQKPIVGPMPNDVQAPGRLRNIFDDPFSVRSNRETTAAEFLLTYDPTPATWMYEWDNDRAEDAKFGFNVGYVFRHHPTAQDAAIGFLSNRQLFAFSNSAPARDLWEVHSRVVSKLNSNFGLIANFYGGNVQANGDDARLVERFGGDIRLIYKKIKVVNSIKVNDWGPFDYHRDFNLTYPVQLMLDISTTLGKPDWFVLPNTRMGIRGTWRSLNEYSPRYLPMQAPEFGEPPISPVGFDNGTEWEIRTYVHINIGK